MRRLIFQEYVTLDGYAAGPDGGLEFFDSIACSPDDNLELLESVDTMLLGAETYRLFVFWPTEASAGEVIAEKLNALRLVVVSTTLASAPWGDYEPGLVVRDMDAVRRSRPSRTEGHHHGAASRTRCCGRLVEVAAINPVLLGAGKSAFPSRRLTGGLELIEARPWGNGGVSCGQPYLAASKSPYDRCGDGERRHHQQCGRAGVRDGVESAGAVGRPRVVAL